MTTPANPDTSSRGPRVNAIGIVVADMPSTLAFYTRLGVIFPAESMTETHVSAPLGGGVDLMFDTEESIRGIYPDWTSQVGSRVALAVELPSPAEVDSLYAALAADGFGHREPWDAFWGQRYACVVDPDGTAVDLYAELPTAPADGASDAVGEE